MRPKSTGSPSDDESRNNVHVVDERRGHQPSQAARRYHKVLTAIDYVLVAA